MEPVATAEDLRAATDFHRSKKDERSKEEKLEEWVEKFDKYGEKTIKEAVREGLFCCSLRLPFQPDVKNIIQWNTTTKIQKKDLRTWVKSRLPGCEVEYVNESMPNVKGGYFTLEISWD